MSDIKKGSNDDSTLSKDLEDLGNIDFDDFHEIAEKYDSLNKKMQTYDDYEHPPVYKCDENSPTGERRIFDVSSSSKGNNADEHIDNSEVYRHGADAQDADNILQNSDDNEQNNASLSFASDADFDELKEDSSPLRSIDEPISEINASKKKTENRGRRSAEIVRKIVLIISVLTILVCASIILNKYAIEPFRAKRSENKILQLKENEDNSDAFAKYPDVDFPSGMTSKYAALFAENSDFAGWLSIPNLGVDFPVVQAENNEKYLKRDFYGSSTKYGTPFLDYRNGLLTLSRNSIIFGHNMSTNDLIFGKLEEYKTIKGFETAPIIEFNTLFAEHKWKVYAVFITNAQKQDDQNYVFNYIFTNVSSDSIFSEYIEQIDQRKLYTTGVDINASDKILTLSTCAYEFHNARLVVVARMVRDGESIEVNTSLAKKNPSPRYPQIWYDTYNNGVNPYSSFEKWFPH